MKQSRQEESDLKVLVSSKTKIVKSPKKFKIDSEVAKGDQRRKGSEVTTLELFKDDSEHQRVTVKGKVIEVSPVEKITVKSSGMVLMKRDFVIADSASLRRCVAWEEHVERFRKMKVIN